MFIKTNFKKKDSNILGLKFLYILYLVNLEKHWSLYSEKFSKMSREFPPNCLLGAGMSGQVRLKQFPGQALRLGQARGPPGCGRLYQIDILQLGQAMGGRALWLHLLNHLLN